MMRSAFDMVSACASVLATTKSTPSRPLAIMLLTALPPAPPVPNTVIRGLSSRISGIFRLMLMAAAPSLRAGEELGGGDWENKRDDSSEALPKPASDSCDVASGSLRCSPRLALLEMFQMRYLRIDQKAGRGGEGRALGFLRQSGDPEWPANADRPIEDASGEIGKPAELTCPAGEDDVSVRHRRKRRGREPVADHFQDFLDARLDDVDQRGARNKLRRIAIVMAHRRNGDHIALVRSTGDHTAIQRLDSLGIGEARVEAAGQICGHVAAAEGKAINMDEAATDEDCDPGSAGSHVNHGGAEVGLVISKH